MLVLAAVLLLALALARVEHRVAGGAKLVPQRALVALRQRQSLGFGLPFRLDRLDLRRQFALHRFGCQRRHFVDQGLTPRLGALARRRQSLAQRCNCSLQAQIELFPCARIDAAQIAFAPSLVGFAQPALDRAPVGGLGEQRRGVRRRRRDEFLAPLARFLSLRREFGKISGRGGVGLLAGAVEALPQRLGHARVLLVEQLSIRCAASAPPSRVAVGPASARPRLRRARTAARARSAVRTIPSARVRRAAAPGGPAAASSASAAAPAPALRAFISSAAARAACTWPAASACSAACSKACSCCRAAFASCCVA